MPDVSVIYETFLEFIFFFCEFSSIIKDDSCLKSCFFTTQKSHFSDYYEAPGGHLKLKIAQSKLIKGKLCNSKKKKKLKEPLHNLPYSQTHKKT